ncbi:hypothetical protein BJX96DRAFT_158332 [Aspergillus floccosus]
MSIRREPTRHPSIRTGTGIPDGMGMPEGVGDSILRPCWGGGGVYRRLVNMVFSVSSGLSSCGLLCPGEKHEEEIAKIIAHDRVRAVWGSVVSVCPLNSRRDEMDLARLSVSPMKEGGKEDGGHCAVVSIPSWGLFFFLFVFLLDDVGDYRRIRPGGFYTASCVSPSEES